MVESCLSFLFSCGLELVHKPGVIFQVRCTWNQSFTRFLDKGEWAHNLKYSCTRKCSLFTVLTSGISKVSNFPILPTCYLRKFPLKNIEKCNLLFWATINLNQGHFTGKSGSLAILIISVIPINERTIRNSEAVFLNSGSCLSKSSHQDT